jgi:hypothetical protein
MNTSMWKLFRALAGVEAGCSCRRCTESIRRSDPFGMSEGVCAPCRRAAA